ncbi:MAG: response regulator [Magnetococcales bacterium]|nr:response regulator [Magnetococcales bacterium]
MADILVIDDDVQFLQYLNEVLSDEGHKVETASNGSKGLKMLEEKPFDVLITDIFMPEKDGIELLRDLRKTNLEIKIIAISGGGQNYSPDMALGVAEMLGTAKTLNKPFTKKDLLPILDELLAS